MKEKDILITSGNGKTGRRIAQRLAEKGFQNIRIGSRKGNPPFDWENENTWDSVFEGVSKVYLAYQPDMAVPGAPEVIRRFSEKAAAKGIRKAVMLSGRGEKEAQNCEEIVLNILPESTVVRASWFNQNFSEGFFLDNAISGQIMLPKGNVPEPFVDTDDIADVATELLLSEKHQGRIYEITGPELLTFEEITSILSQATGRRFIFRNIELDEYISLLRQHQVPEDFLWLVHYLFDQVLDGRNASVSHDTEKVLGRKAKSFSQYARETAETGIWTR